MQSRHLNPYVSKHTDSNQISDPAVSQCTSARIFKLANGAFPCDSQCNPLGSLPQCLQSRVLPQTVPKKPGIIEFLTADRINLHPAQRYTYLPRQIYSVPCSELKLARQSLSTPREYLLPRIPLVGTSGIGGTRELPAPLRYLERELLLERHSHVEGTARL